MQHHGAGEQAAGGHSQAHHGTGDHATGGHSEAHLEQSGVRGHYEPHLELSGVLGHYEHPRAGVGVPGAPQAGEGYDEYPQAGVGGRDRLPAGVADYKARSGQEEIVHSGTGQKSVDCERTCQVSRPTHTKGR
jgi:hypothetical protein